MSPGNHDTHTQWKSNNDNQNIVWDYYNNIISLQIVREAFSRHKPHQPLTLLSLYHTLARARAKCEWVKTHLGLTENIRNEDLEYIVTAEIETGLMISDFGRFIREGMKGSNSEPNLFSKRRGEHILKLLEKRLPDELMHSTEFKEYPIGLSTIRAIEESQPWSVFNKQSVELFHPRANMITIADRDFQSLLNTHNIFDFFTSAARLMFHLSNFPPIVRGSAAVNSWLIDHVFNIKFDVKNSIRPFLYDWVAFFETFEQYKTFYVISAVIEYLKSIAIFCEPDFLDLYRHINKVLLLDPNDTAVLEKRESAWSQLKLLIQSRIENFKDTQKVNLQNILNGELQFRTPAPEISQFYEKVKSKEDFSVEQIKDWINLNYLKGVMEVNENTAKKYLKFQGSPDEEKFNRLWADLSYLRMKLGPDKFIKLAKLLELDFDLKKFVSRIFSPKDDENAMAKEITKASSSSSAQPHNKQHDAKSTLEITYPELQVKSLSEIGEEYYQADLLNISYAEFSDVMKLRDDQKILLLHGAFIGKFINLEKQGAILQHRAMRLSQTINSGGMRIQDMLNLSTAMLEVLISPAANLLYNSNLFIHSSDLQADTVILTQSNILRLLAKHYCNQTLPQVPDLEIQKLLLYPELFQTKKLSLSTIAASIENMEKYLLKTYICHFFEEHGFDEAIDNFTTGQVYRYLNKVKNLFILNLDQLQLNMLLQRYELKKNGLSAFGLMQLEDAEIENLMNSTEILNSDELKRIKQKYQDIMLLTNNSDTSNNNSDYAGFKK